MLVLLLTIGVNVYLYVKIPKGFFPQQDTGRLTGNVQGEQHISYQALVEKAKWFESRSVSRPGCRQSTCRGSPAAVRAANSAHMFVELKDLDVRKVTRGPGDRPLCAARPPACLGRSCFCRTSQDIRIGGRQEQRAISVHAAEPGSRCARGMGAEGVLDSCSTIPELADVSSDQQNSGLSSTWSSTAIPLAPRPHGAGSGHRALRRLRPAPGLDDVQVDQSVSRGSGACAAMVGKPGLPEDDSTCRRPKAPTFLCRPSRTSRRASRRSSHHHQGQFPATTISFNLPEGRFAGHAVDAINKAEHGDGPARQHHRASSPARRRPFRIR